MDSPPISALLARQGIYDKAGNVYAYELLYRTGSSDVFAAEDATSLVITQLFSNLGIDAVIGDKIAFINFTYRHLTEHIPRLLPKSRIVIEVLESVPVDELLINSLCTFKDLGYQIALDDFVYTPQTAPLIELADIIKLDVLHQNKRQIAQQLKALRTFKGVFLAEKIEDYAQYKDCIDLGFTFFQGFYLHKPGLYKGQRITENKSALVRVLAELNNEAITMEKIEENILQIPKLSYRILRLANSVSMYRGQKINSLIDAIRKLGINQIRSWLCLFLFSIQDDIIPELLERTLIRAKMCENLARAANYADPHQAYTVGILSTLDLFLNEPMPELLGKIELSQPLNDALLHYKGDLGYFLQITVDYECGQFKKLERASFSNEELTRAYLDGIEYTTAVMNIINN